MDGRESVEIDYLFRFYRESLRSSIGEGKSATRKTTSECPDIGGERTNERRRQPPRNLLVRSLESLCAAVRAARRRLNGTRRDLRQNHPRVLNKNGFTVDARLSRSRSAKEPKKPAECRR
jgi:hypothetical protein